MSNLEQQIQRANQLFKLHTLSEPLLLANVWEPLGAAMIQNLGHQAIATSSSAAALTSGYLDGENIPFEVLVTQLKQIVKTVSIPVTADIESGYAPNNRILAENIKTLIETGIVGINFEDTDKSTGKLFPIPEQVEKIRIIKKIAFEAGIPFFVNARIDCYVHAPELNSAEKLDELLRRAKAYEAAGADGLFPILLTDSAPIKALVEHTSLPVNIMTYPGIPTYEALKTLGVKRISMGSGLLKIAMKAMKNAVESFQHTPSFDAFFQQQEKASYLESLIADKQ